MKKPLQSKTLPFAKNNKDKTWTAFINKYRNQEKIV